MYPKGQGLVGIYATYNNFYPCPTRRKRVALSQSWIPFMSTPEAEVEN